MQLKLLYKNKVVCCISASGHQKIYGKSISINRFNLRNVLLAKSNVNKGKKRQSQIKLHWCLVRFPRHPDISGLSWIHRL